MNIEIEKLKQMLIATREKNGARACRLPHRRRCLRAGALRGRCMRAATRAAGPGPPRSSPRPKLHPPAHPPAGVYVPAAQYEQECEERRQLGTRVEELEAEVRWWQL